MTVSLRTTAYAAKLACKVLKRVIVKMTMEPSDERGIRAGLDLCRKSRVVGRRRVGYAMTSLGMIGERERGRCQQ